MVLYAAVSPDARRRDEARFRKQRTFALIMAIPEEENKNSAMQAQILVSVVDDDESVRESLPDLLREFGFAARTFSSAEEFLSAGNLEETRCLILDIAMPGLSGPELKRVLDGRGIEIPVVFITAHPESAARDVLQSAVGLLVKPFSDTALLAALRKALKME